MKQLNKKKKKKNARVLRNSGPELYIYIYMNINLCINKSLYILYIYFTTEEKFIFEISTFVVDAIVAHIPRQRILDFKEIKKK